MGRTDIEVLYFNHSFKQPSVIARIKGNGPHASERVIIGAHEDSIVGAGADDDGSGVATVLEAFRVIAASDYKPDRTIEFILYAAEEPGLIGSHYVAASYASKEIPVAGVLQLDMTLYPDSAHKFFMFTGSSCPSPAITQFLLKLAKTYSAMGVTTSAENNYSTDHASWCSVGTPATRVREGKDLNPYMHSTEDTSDRVDPVFGLEFVKLSIAFAVEVAEAPIQK